MARRAVERYTASPEAGDEDSDKDSIDMLLDDMAAADFQNDNDAKNWADDITATKAQRKRQRLRRRRTTTPHTPMSLKEGSVISGSGRS